MKDGDNRLFEITRFREQTIVTSCDNGSFHLYIP